MKKTFIKISGVSLLEVLLAVVIFVIGFVPLLRLFSESGLSQQRILRDFPVTISIAERLLVTIENEIREEKLNPEMFNSKEETGVDITESVVENQQVSLALENFYGAENKDATQFLNKCRVYLKTEPLSDPNLIKIKVSFLWNDRPAASSGYKHKIELFRLISKL